jgi:hypothetical protein
MPNIAVGFALGMLIGVALATALFTLVQIDSRLLRPAPLRAHGENHHRRIQNRRAREASWR